MLNGEFVFYCCCITYRLFYYCIFIYMREYSINTKEVYIVIVLVVLFQRFFLKNILFLWVKNEKNMLHFYYILTHTHTHTQTCK